MCGVEFGEAGGFDGEFIQREDGTGGANRHTGAAVDAFARIYEELGGVGEAVVFLLGVNAVYRAGLHTQFILSTCVRDYVCHMRPRLQLRDQTGSNRK